MVSPVLAGMDRPPRTWAAPSPQPSVVGKMLVALLNVPRTPEEWAIWSFAHQQSHLAIAQAIAASGGATLASYQLDPIPPDDERGWLERNQESHNDMNEAIGTQSSDLLDTDLSDDRQLQSWVYLHFLEHQTAEQRLGI